MWWPPDKIFVHLAPINGIPCTHVANFQDCEHNSDAFVNLVMRQISRSMKRHVLSITGKMAQKKRLENHNWCIAYFISYATPPQWTPTHRKSSIISSSRSSPLPRRLTCLVSMSSPGTLYPRVLTVQRV